MIDSTHTPISRSSNDKSQTIGAAINAKNAIGQLKTRSTQHVMKSSRTFMAASARNKAGKAYQRRTTQAQRPGARDATIANPDAMPGSLQRMVCA
jgi:glycerol kinase